ncbi:MAG: serine hydrolase [Pseudomonadota bacterium]
MSRTARLLTTSLFISAATAMSAAAASSEEVLASKLRAVEAVLDAKLAKESVPGAAFAIVSDQDRVWTHTYGVEDLSTRRSVTEDTAFSICSVSKLFTGIAVMDLVEAGRVELDAPLSDYLGEDAGPGPDAGGEDATVRNILSHVSGLPREGETDFWFANTFPDSATLRADIAARTDWYSPYDHWQYSNLGMAALGEVIEAASGRDFHAYVYEEILEPLGLTDTTTDMPFERVGNGFARGYYVRDAKGVRAPVQPHSFKAFAPAAGVASSVSDLADFMAWNFRLRDADSPEILEPKTLRQMQRVHWTGEDFDEPAWGLAYATRRVDGKTLWGHGGYCPGTVTEFAMRNPDKIGVVAMATANDISAGGLGRIVYQMAADDVKALRNDEDEPDAPAESSESSEPEISMADYEDHYAHVNYDSDLYVGLTEGGLFSVPLYADKPQDRLETYRHEDGDTFIRQREDGTDAEPLRFLRDEDGRITEVLSGGYRLVRQ